MSSDRDQTKSPGMQMFEKLLQAHRASDREAMSLASVASYVETGKSMQHAARRHEAQADAYLKAKFAACGQPEAYTPPEDEETMGSTLINCTFNGDEALQQITTAIGEMASKDDEKATDEPKPSQPDGQTERKRPWWGRLFGTLGAVALGAAITYGTARYFQSDPTQYDVTALPYQPGYNPFLNQEQNE